jgi:hypothetical protein
MSSWLVVVTGLIYAGICIEQFSKNNMGVAVMFFGYALSNVGIYFQVK